MGFYCEVYLGRFAFQFRHDRLETTVESLGDFGGAIVEIAITVAGQFNTVVIP